MGPVLACIVGVLLGLRLNALVLVPATVAAAMVYGLANMMSGRSVFSEPGYLVILVAAAQAGYFVGLLSRDISARSLHRLTHGQTKRV